MQALNVEAEFRKAQSLGITTAKYPDIFATDQVRRGEWVEDDGDYYLPEVWATQYDGDQGDNYTGPTYPEYDD